LIVRSIPLYVGHSQVIFWRLHEKSKPFDDATYNPELFYRWNLESDQFTSVDFGPWAHHSNGKGGLASRSIDESFVRVRTRFSAKNLTLLLSLTTAAQYNLDDTNRDFYKYHGPFEFQVSMINFFDLSQVIDKGELTVRFFPGGRYGERFNMGGYEHGNYGDTRLQCHSVNR
jgi:outer membrane phospholipase A